MNPTNLLFNRHEPTTTAEPYRLLFDANPNPIWGSDDETRQFLAINDASVSHSLCAHPGLPRLCPLEFEEPKQ